MTTWTNTIDYCGSVSPFSLPSPIKLIILNLSEDCIK